MMKSPKIRFKGFDGDWEQRKVSELFKVTRGYVLAATLTEPAKTDEMPYPVYSSQTKDNGLMGYYKDYLYEDAITWTTDGANAGTVNYRAGKFYCTNVCGVLLSNEVTANQMIAEALNNVAKGYVSYVGNPKLMNNVMADIEIMIPTQSEEREKLSVLFRNLDNLITLHQCKDFSLKSVFEESKNFISALRKNTSWEQRKFEDLYNYASEGGTPDTNNSSFYENGDVPFVKIEDTENKYIDSTKSYITQEGLSHSSAWLIPESSVIFTNGATVGNVAINRLPVATKQGILGIIPSKNVLTEFLFYLLSSATFQREVRSRMATGTFATIILKNLNQIPVCIPSDKSEQEEIAGYLSAFDNLITLHQRIKINITGDYHDKKDK